MSVQAGTTVDQALALSGLLKRVGLQHDAALSLGIYGKKCSPETVLNQFDRIEIYRPLLLSPTEARRLRAKTAKK